LEFSQEIKVWRSKIKSSLAAVLQAQTNVRPCGVFRCLRNNRIWAISGSSKLNAIWRPGYLMQFGCGFIRKNKTFAKDKCAEGKSGDDI
jgi:hypothetical protein